MTDNEIIDEIQAVRIKNNQLWMDILRAAMSSAPVETKDIMKQIRQNDLRISDLTWELSK